MKKVLSILLAVVLVFGMLPASALTVFAADTEIAFELGANGNASHYDGSEKTSYSETVGDYTLDITGGSKMYTGARDAKGNSCIKLGTSSAVGGFGFTVPDDVTSVVIAIAKYKSNASTVTINGTTTTLTKNSADGAYDAITIDTTSTKTVTLTTTSSGKRAMVNTITYIVPAAEGACEHPEDKLTLKTAQHDPNCTEVGYEAIYTCSCGEEVGGAEIPATNHANKTLQSEAVAGTCQTEGTAEIYYCPDCEESLGGASTGLGDHSYADGICKVCGEPEPDEMNVTISFATTDQRVSLETESQVWAKNGVTFTNNKAKSTNNVADYSNPVRLYKSSELFIEAPGNITKIIFNCNTASYADDLKASVGDEATVSDKVVTVIPAASASSYTVAALSAQVRLDSMVVTYATSAAEPVVEMGGKEYTSFEEAYTEDPDTLITLLTNLENIDVTGDLYLDLNGYTASVDNANAIYACDSSASAAAAGTGSITTSSEVVMDNTVNGVRYIALNDNGTYTFHALEMKLSAVTLRAKVVEENEQIIEENGIYYKATYACDDTLKNAIDSYGVVFSLNNMPGADFKTEQGDRNLYTAYDKESFESNKIVTSGSIFGIMKEGLENNAERGKMKIYANAYIIINGVNNGEPLMADVTNAGTTWTEGYTGVAYSLFDVMDKLDEKWDTLSEAQKTTIQTFYDYWAGKGMDAWAAELPNIAG